MPKHVFPFFSFRPSAQMGRNLVILIRRALHILLYTFDSPGNRPYTSTVPANLKGEKGFRHKTAAWDRF